MSAMLYRNVIVPPVFNEYSLEEWVKLKRIYLKQMTDVEAAWVGCAIQGEGMIDVGGKTSEDAPHLVVYNTELKFLERVENYTGCGKITAHNTKSSILDSEGRRYKTRQMFQWGCYNRPQILNITKQVLPHLTSKQELALSLLDKWSKKSFKHYRGRYRCPECGKFLIGMVCGRCMIKCEIERNE